MKSTIASEKEKILRELINYIWVWLKESETIGPEEYFRNALDHIASVARQEGREEAIEEIKKDLEWNVGTGLVKNFYTKTPDAVVMNREQVFERLAKITGKEEGK